MYCLGPSRIRLPHFYRSGLPYRLRMTEKAAFITWRRLSIAVYNHQAPYINFQTRLQPPRCLYKAISSTRLDRKICSVVLVHTSNRQKSQPNSSHTKTTTKTHPITTMSSLLVFHQGGNSNGQLWYKTSPDGTNWAADQMVPQTSMSADPSPVHFQGKIYVFHQGANNNGELWYDVLDNGQWERDVLVPKTGITAGPSAIVYENKIYVFHQGANKNGQLWYNVFDGASWAGDVRVQNVGMSDGRRR